MDTDLQKLQTFFGQYSSLSYAKGEILINADEDPSGIFFLLGGSVRQYIITSQGEEITVNIYKPHTFFPLTWGLNQTKNSFYFEAMEPCTCLRAPREAVVSFLEKEPTILMDLTRRLLKGVDGLLGRIVHGLSGNARSKIIFTILNLAYRFGSPLPAQTHKDLATLTGTTRETVSRELKRLENEGIVAMENGSITVPDMKHLEQALTNADRMPQPLP